MLDQAEREQVFTEQFNGARAEGPSLLCRVALPRGEGDEPVFDGPLDEEHVAKGECPVPINERQARYLFERAPEKAGMGHS